MSLDLGSRIRDARVLARLTQAQLAEGICTASYLSLIESGKREPAPQVLNALAKRLGVNLGDLSVGESREALMRLRLAHEQAVPALAKGDFIGVEELLAPHVNSPLLSREPDLRIALLRQQVMALEGQGKLAAALRILRELVPFAAARGDVPGHLDLAIIQLRCLRESGDLNEAVDLARRLAADFPAELEGSATHARLLSTLIGLHELRGDITTALLLAEEAVRRFPADTDPYGRGVLLWNAAIAVDGANRPEAALLLARESADLIRAGENQRHLALVHIAIAYLYARLTPPMLDEAEEQLRIARGIFGDAIMAFDEAYIDDEYTRLATLRGDFRRAIDHGLRALASMEQTRDSLLSGRTHLRLARAYTLNGDLPAATNAMERAQSILALTGGVRQVSQEWRELGDSFAMIGQSELALAAYRQALNDVGVRAVAVDTTTVSSIHSL